MTRTGAPAVYYRVSAELTLGDRVRIADEDTPGDLGSQLRRLERGDLEALDGIYRLAAADVFALALWICGSRDEAAEVVQDVFVKLAARAGGPGGCSPIRNARAWLLAVARRSTVDRLRRQRPSESAEDLLLEALAELRERTLNAARAAAREASFFQSPPTERPWTDRLWESRALRIAWALVVVVVVAANLLIGQGRHAPASSARLRADATGLAEHSSEPAEAETRPAGALENRHLTLLESREILLRRWLPAGGEAPTSKEDPL